jgi:crossover junction endodeoxyribonuclease RuvC
VRVLGVDPGTLRLGYGVVERVGHRLVHVASGTIVAPSREPLERRLLHMYDGLCAVLDETKPESVGLEDVYVGEHVQAALALGHARGIVMLAATQRGLPLVSYPASVVKRTVVGRGSATKDQVALIVAGLLTLERPASHDTTDALGIAITHANASRFASTLAAALPTAPKRPRRR